MLLRLRPTLFFTDAHSDSLADAVPSRPWNRSAVTSFSCYRIASPCYLCYLSHVDIHTIITRVLHLPFYHSLVCPRLTYLPFIVKWSSPFNSQFIQALDKTSSYLCVYSVLSANTDLPACNALFGRYSTLMLRTSSMVIDYYIDDVKRTKIG